MSVEDFSGRTGDLLVDCFEGSDALRDSTSEWQGLGGCR